MSRKTVKDVEIMFNWFVSAMNASITSTEDWVLHYGNSTYGRQYAISSSDGRYFKAVGSTATEACKTISAIVYTLEFVKDSK